MLICIFLLSIFEIILEIIKDVVFLLGYLATPNSFPQPLDPDEECRLLNDYRNGSEEARNILIERNLRLVAHVVKKYSTGGNDADDLISIGTIGLIKAITTYDNEKGTRLATYAARCIENEILMNIRADKKKQNEVYLQDAIGTDKEGNEITLNDILSIEADSVIDKVELKIQTKKLYEKMKSVLKNRERIVLELRYGLNNGVEMTQREIAKILGISRSYVSRIEKKAIKKLAKELKGESSKKIK